MVERANPEGLLTNAQGRCCRVSLNLSPEMTIAPGVGGSEMTTMASATKGGKTAWLLRRVSNTVGHGLYTSLGNYVTWRRLILLLLPIVF